MMNRREFSRCGLSVASIAMLRQSLAKSGAAAERPDFEVRQSEIDLVIPRDFKAYWRTEGRSSDASVQTHTSRFKAIDRLEKAFEKVLKEAKDTVVDSDIPAVWSVYNMGYIVKTRESLFSIDLVHRRDAEFAPLLDFSLITHNQGDQGRPSLYGAMNSSHKTVISNFLDNYGATHWGGAKNDRGCGFTRAVKEFKMRDVTVRTALVDHNSLLIDFTTAFEIKIGGFTIYHTGDCASLSKLKPSSVPDIWMVHPFCGVNVVKGAQVLKPRLVALSHLNELAHAKGRARWTWANGLKVKERLAAKGTNAIVPLWGDRIS